jgi:hypothetical protein
MPFRGYRAGIGTVEAEVTQCAVVQVLEGACRPAGQGACFPAAQGLGEGVVQRRQAGGDADASRAPQREGVTRQTVFDRSSATINAPLGSTVTPTGRPMVLPSAWKPVTKSTGAPLGRPSLKGTKITL